MLTVTVPIPVRLLIESDVGFTRMIGLVMVHGVGRGTGVGFGVGVGVGTGPVPALNAALPDLPSEVLVAVTVKSA